MQTARQLEFALFDFRLHAEYVPDAPPRIAETLAEVRDEVAVVRPPAFNRFPHSFQHVFSGGYAAGYYSYKWAEVLSADAFGAFEEHGVFDLATARRFLAVDPRARRQPRCDGGVRRVPRTQARRSSRCCGSWDWRPDHAHRDLERQFAARPADADEGLARREPGGRDRAAGNEAAGRGFPA